MESLEELLSSRLGAALVAYSEQELFSMLVNDVYKPRMHKLYADLYTAVEATFCLNVRKSPFPLERIYKEDPALFAEYERYTHGLKDILPIIEELKGVLHDYSDFNVSEAMEERTDRCKAAPVQWQLDAHHDYITIASGPVEAASNVETSMTQIVQEITVRAQVRELARQSGMRLDRTERVANSLGHLAGVLSQLSSLDTTGIKLALFAGRRSTDRTFLLLQNVMCARHLPHYLGTSSVYAVTLIDRALRLQGITSAEQRVPHTGRLIGTHAHELMSMTAQLMSAGDDEAGGCGNPVCVSALLAHLLFLRANGNLAAATALADTFGTVAFVEAALVTDVPRQFIEDMAALHRNEDLPATDAKVFDLFRVWRLDSGSYEEIAEVVMSGWERRCQETGASNAPARPSLMHSNLSSPDEVLQVSRLPERIRPAVCAFGGLTDGFLPFQLPDGASFELKLASVVMKAVQASVPGRTSASECAGKLGDDANMVKAQVDPRLPVSAQENVKQRMAKMFHRCDVDPARASAALAAAYHDVTRERILCEQ